MPGNIVPLKVVTVHAALAANAAVDFPGAFTNPPTPMHIQVVFAALWDGGDVTLTGTDKDGNALSETVASAPGTTVETVRPFKTVTAAAKSTVGATANTVTLQTGYPTKGPAAQDPNGAAANGLYGAIEGTATAIMLKAAVTSGAVALTLLFWEDGRWWPHPGGALAVDDTMLNKSAVGRFVTAPRKTFYCLWQTGTGVLDVTHLRPFTLNWPA